MLCRQETAKASMMLLCRDLVAYSSSHHAPSTFLDPPHSVQLMEVLM